MSIQIIHFNQFSVSFQENGYLNATAIAKQYRKRVGDYLRNERTQDYIEALAGNLSRTRKITLDKNQLVTVKNGGMGNGTWLHPKLAVDFARWLDPKFAVWCDEQIEQLLSGNQQPKLKPQKPRKALPNGLSGEQQEAVIQLHKTLVQAAPKEEQGKLAITLWSAVKSKYGVSYKELPPEMFAEVLSLMSRVAVEKGVLYGEVLDAEPKPIPEGIRNIHCVINAAAALCSYFEATATAVSSLNRPLFGKTVEHYKILKIYAPQLV